MTGLFGTKYAGYIAAAYGITFAILLAMAVAVVVTYGKRRKQMARLEEQGLKRASSGNG